MELSWKATSLGKADNNLAPFFLKAGFNAFKMSSEGAGEGISAEAALVGGLFGVRGGRPSSKTLINLYLSMGRENGDFFGLIEKRSSDS